MGGEDSNLSISNAGKGNKILGIEDSELSNAGIVGTGHIKKAQGATLNLSSIDPAEVQRGPPPRKGQKRPDKGSGGICQNINNGCIYYILFYITRQLYYLVLIIIKTVV